MFQWHPIINALGISIEIHSYFVKTKNQNKEEFWNLLENHALFSESANISTQLQKNTQLFSRQTRRILYGLLRIPLISERSQMLTLK